MTPVGQTLITSRGSARPRTRAPRQPTDKPHITVAQPRPTGDEWNKTCRYCRPQSSIKVRSATGLGRPGGQQRAWRAGRMAEPDGEAATEYALPMADGLRRGKTSSVTHQPTGSWHARLERRRPPPDRFLARRTRTPSPTNRPVRGAPDSSAVAYQPTRSWRAGLERRRLPLTSSWHAGTRAPSPTN